MESNMYVDYLHRSGFFFPSTGDKFQDKLGKLILDKTMAHTIVIQAHQSGKYYEFECYSNGVYLYTVLIRDLTVDHFCSVEISDGIYSTDLEKSAYENIDHILNYAEGKFYSESLVFLKQEIIALTDRIFEIKSNIESLKRKYLSPIVKWEMRTSEMQLKNSLAHLDFVESVYFMRKRMM